MLNSPLKSKTTLQYFYYVYGPDASRKSSIVNIMVYLLGEKAVHTTTLKRLDQDSFKIVNWVEKKLSIINDTEDYI